MGGATRFVPPVRRVSFGDDGPWRCACELERKLSAVNVYVALLIGLLGRRSPRSALWIARRVRGPADFFVAGRKLTWPLPRRHRARRQHRRRRHGRGHRARLSAGRQRVVLERLGRPRLAGARALVVGPASVAARRRARLPDRRRLPRGSLRPERARDRRVADLVWRACSFSPGSCCSAPRCSRWSPACRNGRAC